MSIYTIDVELNGEIFYRHYQQRSTAQAMFERLSGQLNSHMRSVRLFIQESRKRPKLLATNRWTFVFEDDNGSKKNA